MKQTKALAYLRQLCCSGLDKDVVIQEFLHAVKTVLPSGMNTFTLFDGQFSPAYFIMEANAPTMDEASIKVVFNFFSPEMKKFLLGWFSRHPVFNEPTLIDGKFYHSDMYNLVYRRNEQHHTLLVPVMRSGKPIGILNLFRPRPNRPFNSREGTLMTYLTPYLSHALSAPGDQDSQYHSAALPSLMVMDAHGKMLFMSNPAQQLMALACHPTITLDAHAQEAAVMQQLAQLCQNLNGIFQGKNAAPPSWSLTNSRGLFIFRAHWLNSMNEPSGVVGITIEHQEPLTLKVLRGIQNTQLSPVQGEVVVLMAQGLSNDQIGAKLNIKLSTVKDHVSKIFAKLDISRREELLPKLLALEKNQKTNPLRLPLL